MHYIGVIGANKNVKCPNMGPSSFGRSVAFIIKFSMLPVFQETKDQSKFFCFGLLYFLQFYCVRGLSHKMDYLFLALFVYI
jgi:hypothetical protein